MRKLIFIFCLIPAVALADDDLFDKWLTDQAIINQQPQQVPSQPVYGLPVQPVLPVPQDRGPWGTGYSIVTDSRPTVNLYNRDLTGSETIQRIVPNNALGQPMKGLNLQNW